MTKVHHKFPGNPGFFGTGYKGGYYPPLKPEAEIDLGKVLRCPLGAHYLRELDDENNQMKYSAMGAVLMGLCETREDETLAVPFDTHISKAAHSFRWQLGPGKVAQIERLEMSGKVEEARNEFLKLAIKAKYIVIKDEDLETAQSMGLINEQSPS